MKIDHETALLERCALRLEQVSRRSAESLPSGEEQTITTTSAALLDAADHKALDEWQHRQRDRASLLVDWLMRHPVADWTDAILHHRAHRHPWYEWLAAEVSLAEFASFMLENRHFPAFLPLAERALDVQIDAVARDALLRNIADENVPVPHADLMRRLMLALKTRAGEDLELASFPELIDRTLVFYHGYYNSPWALVGALYMTEAVALHRLQGMDQGLRRLGLTAHELEFVEIHMTCDESHASEWIDCVIAPGIALRPELRQPIAEGIAVALETSARYLDHLVDRAAGRRHAVRLALESTT